MSTITTTAAVHAGEAAERIARASIAFGRKRGYYRLLFEAGPSTPRPSPGSPVSSERRAGSWLDEQVAAGVLRVVESPDGGHDELLLPGEYVPILLGDHGEPEFDGARALLAEHRDELPPALAGL